MDELHVKRLRNNLKKRQWSHKVMFELYANIFSQLARYKTDETEFVADTLDFLLTYLEEVREQLDEDMELDSFMIIFSEREKSGRKQ